MWAVVKTAAKNAVFYDVTRRFADISPHTRVLAFAQARKSSHFRAYNTLVCGVWRFLFLSSLPFGVDAETDGWNEKWWKINGTGIDCNNKNNQAEVKCREQKIARQIGALER